MIIKKKIFLFLLFLICAGALTSVFSSSSFLTPEFDTQYQIPKPVHPSARGIFFEYLDVFVLIAALLAASYFAIKKRSRNGLYMLAVFSVAYFGFYRQGCICPIGAIQNVTLSFFKTGYVIPLSVILFFVLPLLFALFFGRVFCSSVCPLGAIQELFIYKPIRLPAAIKHVLGIIPFIYLGLAVVFACTGSAFLICKFDPFIGFFRMSASSGMLILGGVFLLTGVFIARPYCRFFCPYGVLLGMFSFFSKKHLSITPDACIQSRLCENACPVDAINAPSPKIYKSDKKRQTAKIGIVIVLLPFISGVMGYGFSRMSVMLSRQNRTVLLAERIYREETGDARGTTLDSDAFRQKQMLIQDLYRDAILIRGTFYKGLWLVGIFLGIVISLKIIVLLQRHKKDDYAPDRFHCISCGRCMEYCPVPADQVT